METPEPRPYPEPKEHELTDAEKQGIRECLKRGESSVYVLAKKFECSPSQVAGIKAAMTKAGDGPVDNDSDHDTQ